MISDVSQNLLIGLLAATLLGFIMGYLVARLFTGRKTAEAVQSMQAELTKERAAAEEQIFQLSAEKSELNRIVKAAREKIQLANEKHESNQSQVQRLNQRIQLLEAEVSASEEQYIRLQRDFAAYKSNKTHELELARIKPGNWAQSEQLPVLNKRISNEEADVARSLHMKSRYGSETQRAPTTEPVQHADKSAGQIGIPWSNELDIPTLAESELPDSVEELEFELADLESGGGDTRG